MVSPPPTPSHPRNGDEPRGQLLGRRGRARRPGPSPGHTVVPPPQRSALRSLVRGRRVTTGAIVVHGSVTQQPAITGRWERRLSLCGDSEPTPNPRRLPGDRAEGPSVGFAPPPPPPPAPRPLRAECTEPSHPGESHTHGKTAYESVLERKCLTIWGWVPRSKTPSHFLPVIKYFFKCIYYFFPPNKK